jgi:hypothetical protein
MTIAAAKLAGAVALCLAATGTSLAQTSPSPGPTVPPKSLPVPKGGESMVINPTVEECRAGWRKELKWSKAEFDKFCTQLEVSK